MESTRNHETDDTVPPLANEEILEYIDHCHEPLLMLGRTNFSQSENVGSLQFNKNPSLLDEDAKGINLLMWEYAEHQYLGDMLILNWHDGQNYLAKDKPYRLQGGVRLTYGQINALGGDYYGSSEPISLGRDLEEQKARFAEGWKALAGGDSLSIRAILGLKAEEVSLINEAARDKQDSSVIYNTKMKSQRDDILASILGLLRPGAGYLGLSLFNFDHFGDDARTAYDVGHASALDKAASERTPAVLETAYAMNAFADHFLEDSFSAGHIRVPRRRLHGTLRPDKDACSYFMHAEDNALGLHVQNPAGEAWICYGDKKLLDKVNVDNFNRMHAALMASTQEIYDAWSTGKVIQRDKFRAWQHAPVIASAFSEKNHAPLFNAEGIPRINIANRKDRKYRNPEGFWTYPTLLVELKTSPAFKEPILP